METLTDPVRPAFEKAMPSKVAASWGHANGLNIAGWDSRINNQYVTMALDAITSGGSATPHQDGRHAVPPECCFRALTSSDVELLEYSYPIIIHRYLSISDLAGAGKFRGGSGAAWEAEPLDTEMLCIGFGDGPGRCELNFGSGEGRPVRDHQKRQCRTAADQHHGADPTWPGDRQHEPGQGRVRQSL
jgi:N-methylhydantoinase B